MRRYELLTADGKTITWPGEDAINAAERAADCLRVTIVAWRELRVSIEVGPPEDC